jgi:hypothetical protein
VTDTSNQYLAHDVTAVHQHSSEVIRYGRLLFPTPPPGPSSAVGNHPSTDREETPLTEREEKTFEDEFLTDREETPLSNGKSETFEEEYLEWEQSEEGVEGDRIVSGGGWGGERYSIFKEESRIVGLKHSGRLHGAGEGMLKGGEIDKGEAARLRRRFREMERCGERLAVRKCGCCGEYRVGTGSYAGTHRTCKCRVCPACSWVRAKQGEEFFKVLAREVDGGGLESFGYRWQFLTVTTIYRPALESDVSRPALRKRAFFLKNFVRELWKGVLNDGLGAGLHRSIEVSPRGHVHAHLLYYGPPVDMTAVSALTRKKGRGIIGHTDWKEIHKDCNYLPGEAGAEERAAAVGRVARYMAKGTSTYGATVNEDIEAGEGAGWTMSPVLAARWESAIVGLNLTQRYGVFLGYEAEKTYKYEHPDDSEVACPKCKTVGNWETVYVNAENWFIYCHEKGSPGLIGGDWIPWWRRAKLKGPWKPPPKQGAG